MMKRVAIYAALAIALTCTALGQQRSVLAGGDWWRLTVERSGAYRLTTAELPALSGAACDSIGLYGADGEQLSTSNSAVATDGLGALPIEVVDANGDGRFGAGDEVLFFGEGCDVWRYEESLGRWEMRRHAYAKANHYFLTTSAHDALRIATSRRPEGDTTIATYTAVAVHNNDQYNIFRTGQQWMGEKFSASVRERTVSLGLPATATGIKVRYALASKGGGTFGIACTGLNNSHTIAARTVYGAWRDATTATAATLTFTLTYTPGEATSEGYLDYIEMSGHVPISYSGQLLLRNDQHLGSGTAAFALRGAERVWDVTAGHPTRALALDEAGFCDATDAARCYVAFGSSNAYTPAAITKVANQDLIGCGPADYVVVTLPQFKAQADRIAALHAVGDAMATLVVTDEEVYNEFSSGKQDPMAIRTLLRSLRTLHPGQPPRYLLLLGKPSYDPRGIKTCAWPTLVTYETPYSFDDDGVSYASDDMMGYLDDGETGGSNQSLDVSVGRLPAKSEAEARRLADKVEAYMMRSDLGSTESHGDWRNSVALLSDDADPGHPGDTAFVHSSEATARRITALFPNLNIDRFYADAYHQQSDAIGSFYPELKNALRQRINKGCLLLNYIGHGSTHYIGTERYVEPSDIDAFSNRGRWPLFVTSTCSYGYHDLTDEVSGAEAFVLADGGAVAVVSATRPISHNERFNTDVILYALDAANTIGDAVRLAKNRTAVSPSIGLCGDPALRLSVPENRVVVTHIDGREVSDSLCDTATVLSRVTVRGEVVDADGALIGDFDGKVYPTVFDRESESSTLANDNPGTEVRFCQQKSILYKGSAEVSGGRFEYSFIVPRDVAYQYAAAKLSHYAVSAYEHASGCYGRLYLGGLDEEAAIGQSRPEIRLFLGDTNFRNGGITDENPTLIALLSDSVGINAFGSGLGHDITATLDGQAGSTVVLNDLYEQDIDDSRRGMVSYRLENLTAGTHTLTLKAWNIWGLSNSATVSFCVHGSDTACFSQLKAYPNPASGHTTFHFETNSTAAINSAELHIFSATGGKMQTLSPQVSDGGYTVGPVRWDLRQVPPGIYLARMLIITTDGEAHHSTAKVIVK